MPVLMNNVLEKKQQPQKGYDRKGDAQFQRKSSKHQLHPTVLPAHKPALGFEGPTLRTAFGKQK